jgi:cytochrome c-type biogenesis protein CcmH
MIGRAPRRAAVLLALAAGLAALPAAAQDRPLPDPAAEAEAQALMRQLRCVVCQHESIGESNADVAIEMRALVRERIAAGESPEEVRAWMVSRYGDWISFAPPARADTALLWAAPLLFLGLGALFARGLFRRSAAAPEAGPDRAAGRSGSGGA